MLGQPLIASPFDSLSQLIQTMELMAHESLKVHLGIEQLTEILILLLDPVAARLELPRKAGVLYRTFDRSHRLGIVVVELRCKCSYLVVDENRQASY